MKPGKQRKAHFNAAMHEKRKRLSAETTIREADARFDGVRTVTVRVGDTVKVVRRRPGTWWKATRWNKKC